MAIKQCKCLLCGHLLSAVRLSLKEQDIASKDYLHSNTYVHAEQDLNDDTLYWSAKMCSQRPIDTANIVIRKAQS